MPKKGTGMKVRKKTTNSKTDQKRLFLRMKSPSAFGSARRFDSASFMNVPPEMARRDAAYMCFSAYFRTCDLSGKNPVERTMVYDRILQLFRLIEDKSEFLLNSDVVEKRNLENAESLAFIRLLQKYIMILSNLAAAQIVPPRPGKFPANAESLVAGSFFDGLNPRLRQYEDSMIESVRNLLNEKHDLLLAQKEQRSKHFSKSDSERYERAFALYMDFYADLKNI
jgi:hypothetical protein